jgi:hypothetical protein
MFFIFFTLCLIFYVKLIFYFRPLTCPAGILSPRGEGDVCNIPLKSPTQTKLQTFSSPLGERMPIGLVRGFFLF